MTTTDQILQFKHTIRDTKIAEAQECLRLAVEAAETISGNRVKHHGAMEVVGVIAKHLKNLQEN